MRSCCWAKVPLQIKPQVGLIAVVVHQAVGKMVVVGVSKGICQIVGQLAQGIVLPHRPMSPPLEAMNSGINIELRVGKIVPPKLLAPQEPFR